MRWAEMAIDDEQCLAPMYLSILIFLVRKWCDSESFSEPGLHSSLIDPIALGESSTSHADAAVPRSGRSVLLYCVMAEPYYQGLYVSLEMRESK